jgi:hypothetical protein
MERSRRYNTGFWRIGKIVFPLSFWDVSLWLAATAVILLIAGAVVLPLCGEDNLQVSRTRLMNVAFAVSLLFLATMMARIVGLIYPS